MLNGIYSLTHPFKAGLDSRADRGVTDGRGRSVGAATLAFALMPNDRGAPKNEPLPHLTQVC